MTRTLFCTGQGIGNVIMATPAIKASAKISGSPVDLYLAPTPKTVKLKELFFDQRFVRRIRQFPEQMFEDRYDYIIVTSNFSRTAILEGRRNVIRLERIPPGIREEDSNIELVRKIGYRGRTPDPFVVKVPMKGKRIFRPSVGIHPGCKEKWRRIKAWPGFQRLAGSLSRDGIKVWVFIGTEELRFFNRDDWPADASVVSGLELPQVAWLAGKMDAFVAGDSGLLHLAGAAGTRTVGIFGSTDPERSLPRGAVLVRSNPILPCQPCYYRLKNDLNCERSPDCEVAPCLLAVSQKQVESSVRLVLDKGGNRRRKRKGGK